MTQYMFACVWVWACRHRECLCACECALWVHSGKGLAGRAALLLPFRGRYKAAGAVAEAGA